MVATIPNNPLQNDVIGRATQWLSDLISSSEGGRPVPGDVICPIVDTKVGINAILGDRHYFCFEMLTMYCGPTYLPGRIMYARHPART